jgi:syndecan 1
MTPSLQATGAPNGLSCDKEGWFISSWERQGQWVAGGGYVPLSHAICCRPCVPDELPPDASGRIPPGQAPLAVISLGCHPSTNREMNTRCEEGAGSFVAGYSEAVKVFTTPGESTNACCEP